MVLQTNPKTEYQSGVQSNTESSSNMSSRSSSPESNPLNSLRLSQSQSQVSISTKIQHYCESSQGDEDQGDFEKNQAVKSRDQVDSKDDTGGPGVPTSGEDCQSLEEI